MGWLSALPIFGKILGGPVEKIIDKMGEGDRQVFQQAMARMEAEAAVRIEQSKVNAEAAKHPSIFVAGWRSFIGWACGFAVLFHYFGLASILQHYTGVEIVLQDMSDLWVVMMGMLGLGGMRTAEKFRGVHRNSL